MPRAILEWVSNLTCDQRLKWAALVAFMGEERVAAELVNTPCIDALFSAVAERIYA